MSFSVVFPLSIGLLWFLLHSPVQLSHCTWSFSGICKSGIWRIELRRLQVCTPFSAVIDYFHSFLYFFSYLLNKKSPKVQGRCILSVYILLYSVFFQPGNGKSTSAHSNSNTRWAYVYQIICSDCYAPEEERGSSFCLEELCVRGRLLSSLFISH